MTRPLGVRPNARTPLTLNLAPFINACFNGFSFTGASLCTIKATRNVLDFISKCHGYVVMKLQHSVCVDFRCNASFTIQVRFAYDLHKSNAFVSVLALATYVGNNKCSDMVTNECAFKRVLILILNSPFDMKNIMLCPRCPFLPACC